MIIRCDVDICIYNDTEEMKCRLHETSISGGCCDNYITVQLPIDLLESYKKAHLFDIGFSEKDDD